ncbi:MAG: M4 family metallopeptidase [Anaerolineales bacterium]|nr:MAG: M4 family metallopeptidase [Anaerolineales bacterium]
MHKFRRLVHTLLIVISLLSTLFLANTVSAQGPEPFGFRALRGAEARSFRVPADVQLTERQQLAFRNLTAERYRQFVDGAEVLGGQLTIYREANGQAVAVIGGHYPNLLTTNEVRLNAGQARAVAVSQVGGEGQWVIDLMVDPATGRYFYRVENQRFDSRWFHWVDGETGVVVNAYNGLTDGSGVGVQGDTKDLAGLTTASGNGYQLVSADGRQSTYDARNRNRLPGDLASDDDDIWNTGGSTSPGQAALVDAHFYANVTDDYYLSTHSFDWLTYYPQGMVSSAHVQRNYNNAYWNGSQMAYGDGDGSTFIELSGDLDVVGHELSHGVTDATSDLIYQNESGALNEAFSDIMGTAIEYDYGSGNWTIGEDVTPDDNGIRNMANPNEDGDPSHYADRYTGTGDNGGVHINSGIANHWFYLLVNGGQNANPARASGTNVQGVGLASAEQVAFLGFTALPANADFCAARAATVAVAGGSAANVADAWDEVGIDEALCNAGGSSGGGGGGGTDTGTGPVISNVASANLKGTKFEITWDTDEPADSQVTFTCCGTYTDSALGTSHRMVFNGQKNVTYEYFVGSTDADGNKSTEGPFSHQN